MTATAMFISEQEPLVVISVGSGRLTEKLINASERFSAVIAGEGQRQLALQVGSSKGEDIDKFSKFDLQTDDRLIPAGASAWFDCKVEKTFEIPGYRVYVGRIVDQEAFDHSPLVWQKNTFHTLSPL
jgi:flavin reductase (DIM6/NTAB) family NADH-FMN oxidoreductase RutF